MRTLFTLSFALSFISLAQAQTVQTFVNQVWSEPTGEPDTVNWSATEYDANGNVYVVGNTSDGFTADMLVTKFDKYGLIAWSQTFDGVAGLSDYGTAAFYQDGLLYTCGATFTSTTNLFDYVVRVYDVNGALQWTTTLNGSGSNVDVPTSIAVDEYGKVYVTGTSLTATEDYNYWTVKLDSVGGMVWSAYYDYGDESDIAVSVTTRNNTVTVAGVSAADSADWDIYLRNYSYAGVYLYERRVTNPGSGRDGLSAVARDAGGNYYLTGRTWNGTDYDVLIARLDPGLNIDWDVAYPSATNDDQGNAVAIDPDGNVYAGGSVGTAGGVHKGILLKLDPDGNLLWERNLFSPSYGQDARLLRLARAEDGSIVTATHAYNATGYDTQLSAYGPNGNPLWTKAYATANDDRPVSLKCDAGFIYFVARQVIPTRHYDVVKYETSNIVFDNVTDSATGLPLYAAQQLIVRFDTAALIKEAIDNKDKTFGTLSDFVDSIVIEQMDDKTGLKLADAATFKMYPKLTTADTTMVTRSGDTVKIQPHWASLLIELPGNAPMKETADSLERLYGTVHWANPNWAVQAHWAPDDSHFIDSLQASLIEVNNNDSAHINATSAWELAKGSPNIMVGIFDGGLDYLHEDLGNGEYGLGMKTEYGIDVLTGTTLPMIYDPDSCGHGTPVAGIVGAISNNGIGIAGIAGGDESTGNEGVHFYAAKVLDGGWCASGGYVFHIGPALLAAVQFGVDVANHSYGTHVLTPWDPFDSTSYDDIRGVYETVWRAGVVNVASRGNHAQGLVDPVVDTIANFKIFPACFPDDMVLNVGGSGNDGELKTMGNPDSAYFSYYGKGMDLLAPGYWGGIYTTQNYPGTNSYGLFSGTSAAAPHVTGVAALLMEYWDNVSSLGPLDPEDVEHLIQLSAKDRQTPGYDNISGWGLLDAGAALHLLQPPHYKLYRGYIDFFFKDSTINNTYRLSDNYSNYPGGSATFYNATYPNTTRYRHFYQQTLGDPGQKIIYTWVRNSKSNLWNKPIVVPGPTPDLLYPLPRAYIASTDTIDANKITYTFEGNSYRGNGGPVSPHYFPYQLFVGSLVEPPKIYYSYLVYDSLATDAGERVHLTSVDLFPNPNTDECFVRVKMSRHAVITVQVTDMQGRLVYSREYPSQMAGINFFPLDTRQYSNSLYLVNVSDGVNALTVKMIKQ